MRELTGHQVNPANDRLRITVTDPPGHGGANHRYVISGIEGGNSSAQLNDPWNVVILFQNGPIAEHGVNGVTHEALLEILIDRLQAFQSGPYACDENAEALKALEEAQRQLKGRTLARMARGVEGTHEK